MIVGIFRSQLRADADAYPAVAARMEALAREQPGFLWIQAFEAADGERLTLFAFESLEAIRAWGAHPEHREAQRRGRAEFYASYSLQLCELVREARFEAPPGRAG